MSVVCGEVWVGFVLSKGSLNFMSDGRVGEQKNFFILYNVCLEHNIFFTQENIHEKCKH